jgi:phage-related protein
MNPASALPVVFYRTEKGAVPVLEWLRSMEAADRKQIGLDLLRVQENWPIGMPLCRSLGDRLWEVRSSLDGGRIARLLFCLQAGEIYVLHGFFKRTQKTPERELSLVRKRMKEVLDEK